MALGLLLPACSWLSKDTAQKPANLVSIDKSLEVKRIWSSNAVGGVDDRYLKLNPFFVPENVIVADAEGRVASLAREDGHTLWKVSLKTNLTAGLNGDDSLALVGSEDGELIALSTDDGSERWRTGLSSEVVAISPVNFGLVVARTNDSKLYGLNSETGAVLWQVGRTPPSLVLRGVSTPLVDGDSLIVGFDDGKLVDYSMLRGSTQWETTVSLATGRSELERLVDIDGRMELQDGVVYVATNRGQLAAVSVAEGRILWTREISSTAGVDVDDDEVFVSDEDDAVWAYDSRTGSSIWKQEQLQDRRVSAPAVVGDYVIVGDLEGYVHWMSRSDGRFVERSRSDGSRILTPPVELDGRAYVFSSSGKLTVYEPVSDVASAESEN